MVRLASFPYLTAKRSAIVLPVVVRANMSSGGIQHHFGSIDRHGNKHLRVLLVEAVWRLLRWQLWPGTPA